MRAKSKSGEPRTELYPGAELGRMGGEEEIPAAADAAGDNGGAAGRRAEEDGPAGTFVIACAGEPPSQARVGPLRGFPPRLLGGADRAECRVLLRACKWGW